MIEFIAETGSTNADLAARLRAGEPLREGHWLVADRQRSGKGRQGRDWADGTGNFMGSTIVRLAPDESRSYALPLVAGLAVYEAVLPRIPQPSGIELKWPNDVLLAGGKLAGILLERQGDAVIVGIGVNLASAPALPDRKTASLAGHGPAPDRDSFAADLAQVFAGELADWRSHGPEPVIARWLAVAHPVDTPLTVHGVDAQPLSGHFAGLAADGALLLRLADGTVRTVHAGDVSRGGD